MSASLMSVKASLRKVNKPLLEKRRRARINACLNQLKNLVLETLRKDTARYSKLEKADILEMTVDYLKALRFQQINTGVLKGPEPVHMSHQYAAGYRECAVEVQRYLDSALDLSPLNRDVQVRLDLHLADCVRRAQESSLEALLSSDAEPQPKPIADTCCLQRSRIGDAPVYLYTAENSPITTQIAAESSAVFINACRDYFQLNNLTQQSTVDCDDNNNNELFSGCVIGRITAAQPLPPFCGDDVEHQTAGEYFIAERNTEGQQKNNNVGSTAGCLTVDGDVDATDPVWRPW